jgi:DNA-binding XRE family transcriptional regulator
VTTYPSIPADKGTYRNNIKDFALERGISIPLLARIISVTDLTCRDLCNGKREPSFRTQRKLEFLLGKSIVEIYPDCYKDLDIVQELIPKEKE